jgi:uncharacterized protein
MKVPFSKISSTGTRYKLNDVPAASENFKLQGPVDFTCTLTAKDGGGVMLRGNITALLLIECDRCLSMVPFQARSEVSLSFVVEDGELGQRGDIELPVADLDLIELQEPVIDLAEIAVWQLDYNLPVKHLCGDSCRGICSACGANLNQDDCRCLEDVGNNPFAILAELKKMDS